MNIKDRIFGAFRRRAGGDEDRGILTSIGYAKQRAADPETCKPTEPLVAGRIVGVGTTYESRDVEDHWAYGFQQEPVFHFLVVPANPQFVGETVCLKAGEETPLAAVSRLGDEILFIAKKSDEAGECEVVRLINQTLRTEAHFHESSAPNDLANAVIVRYGEAKLTFEEHSKRGGRIFEKSTSVVRYVALAMAGSDDIAIVRASQKTSAALLHGKVGEYVRLNSDVNLAGFTSASGSVLFRVAG